MKLKLQHIKNLNQSGQLTIIKLSNVVTIDTLPVIQKEYSAATKGRKTSNVLFDLQEVTYADSSGVAGLLDLMKYMRTHNIKGKIGLINVSERIRPHLMISKVEPIFKEYASIDEALKELG